MSFRLALAPVSELSGLCSSNLISLYEPGTKLASSTFATVPSRLAPDRSSRYGPLATSSISNVPAFSSSTLRTTTRMRVSTMPVPTTKALGATAAAAAGEPARMLTDRFGPPHPATNMARTSAMVTFMSPSRKSYRREDTAARDRDPKTFSDISGFATSPALLRPTSHWTR